jgi:hypothetical protein
VAVLGPVYVNWRLTIRVKKFDRAREKAKNFDRIYRI